MAIQKEIWASDIVGNLFKNNEFAQRAHNADQYVLEGKVVHEQAAGTPSVVKKNLTTFPQVATERADADSTWAIDTFYALPRRIANLDKYELSYDKRQSVVGEDTQHLIESAMNGLLYRWAPTAAAQIVTASGAASADDLLAGATGNRSTFSKADLNKVAKQLDKADYAPFRKTALLTASHYHQFFASLSDAEKTNFNNVANLAEGVIGRYMGIDIMMRSNVLRYRAGAPVDEQDDAFAAGTGDLSASLVWAENSVTRALGDVDVFDNPGQALYYGDVWSAMLRFGGRKRRPTGVFAIVEAAS